MKRTLADWGLDAWYLTVEWLYDSVITQADLSITIYNEVECSCAMQVCDTHTIRQVLPMDNRCELHRDVYEKVFSLSSERNRSQFPITPSVMK